MSNDIFIPDSSPEDALVSPLQTVTYVTASKQVVEDMFAKGMELDMSDWYTPSNQQRAILNPYLGFDENDTWDTCLFGRAENLTNIQVRVICVSQDKPQVRPEIDGLYCGGATIGFPITEMDKYEAKMAAVGINSSVGVKELEFTNDAGEKYVSAEIHFLAPENVFMMGVRRPEIFVQVGPLDSAQGIGAAAYSCRCVDNLDEVNQFFCHVLGYELRRDMAMTVGPKSGLKLAEGMPERFAQAFAPGSGTGYLVFLEHGDAGKASPAPSYGPPNRGIVMWSFASKDIDEVYRRAKDSGVEILQTPMLMESPWLPESRTMLLIDPGGFPIEIFEI